MTINLYWWKIGFLSRSHLPQQDNIDFWKEANGLLKGIVDWKILRFEFFIYSRKHSDFNKL